MAAGCAGIDTCAQSPENNFPQTPTRALPQSAQILLIRWGQISYAKLTNKEGGNDFVHTNHAWDVEVLGMPGTYNRKDYY